LELDLSAVTHATQLTEVDAAADAAANTIKLTLADVLGTAQSGAVHQLKLTGDSNDTAVLTPNEWTATNTTVSDHGHDYTVYNATSSAAVQLLIDQHMLVTQHG
jgi:hypothetical protein